MQNEEFETKNSTFNVNANAGRKQRTFQSKSKLTLSCFDVRFPKPRISMPRSQLAAGAGGRIGQFMLRVKLLAVSIPLATVTVIRDEKGRTKPDEKILSAYRAELKTTKDELRSRGRENKPGEDATPVKNTFDRNAGSYNAARINDPVSKKIR
jgi:hypothetical protein